MSNIDIDKQALREAAEKVNSGDWSYEEFDRLDLPGGSFVKIDGRDAVYCLNKQVGGVEQSRAVIAFIATFNPKVALALLDELEHYKSREERVTKLVLDNSTSWDALYKKLEAAERSIAELERSETQLINERDAAESALADMYQAATGERPEWSNMFGFADAVDVVEERLATLEANQSQTTPTGIQLITEAIGAHGYIVGCLLQGRPDLALEESRKWVSAFGQAAEIVSAQDAAGIGVKGE
ncbi:TPA: ead/Ea22-like family protein [Salmonella enterica]